ncbi:MAG TPA: hypothetical protein VEL11_07255 [Candidatus Bathyarchaeia archaeon]|nr:hypothetical protein [Candidatus Bathyarchaeia archaeon]
MAATNIAVIIKNFEANDVRISSIAGITLLNSIVIRQDRLIRKELHGV